MLRNVLGLDTLFGGDRNDVISGARGNDAITGWNGTDYAAFAAPRAVFTTVLFGPDANGDRRPFMLTDMSEGEGIDTFRYSDVERLRFSDGVLAFDVSGTAGQGYRLYQASFERTPDADVLTYWVKRLDEGAQLRDEAAFFATSPEFSQRYRPLANAT